MADVAATEEMTPGRRARGPLVRVAGSAVVLAGLVGLAAPARAHRRLGPGSVRIAAGLRFRRSILHGGRLGSRVARHVSRYHFRRRAGLAAIVPDAAVWGVQPPSGP